MAKLVVLTEGFAGRTCELTMERTTIGRAEDNAFQIAESSVSSHHCEILLKGQEVSVKDLDSTNGTFINGDRVSEAALKPGHLLRLGGVEIRLEDPNAPAKKTPNLAAAKQGVTLTPMDAGAKPALPTDAFKKKGDKINQTFIVVGIVLGLMVVGMLVYMIFIKR